MTQAQLMEQIDLFIQQNTDALVADIGTLVAQRSVQEAPAPGAPFGPGPRAALDAALAIAARMGFATNDGDGYVGWAELPGKEEGYLATITHLDVVPEGDGWDTDPYQMKQRDGWLLGRGVADDKGASVLCLYTAKFFKEQNFPLRYGLRVLLGCNEESGMGDVPYYLARNPQPLFCFSPDASFPVCNGEKGHFGGQFVSGTQGPDARIVAFTGGVAPNVIPANASCQLKADAAALADTDRVTVQHAGPGLATLQAQGVAGHAAHPDGAINAIGLLADYLLANNLCGERERSFIQLLQRMNQNTDGSGLGIACRDDIFDALTINGGVINLAEGRFTQSIDIRFPTATSGDALTRTLADIAAAHGATLADAHAGEPFYIPPETASIQTLLSAYRDVTGQTDGPFTMGGGTYARHFTNAVSFGPEKSGEDQPDFVGAVHGRNEGANLAGLLIALRVYILALVRLQQVDF